MMSALAEQKARDFGAVFDPAEMGPLVEKIRAALHIVRHQSGAMGIAGETPQSHGECTWMGTLPPLYPEWLGDRSFLRAHAVRFPYVVGEMATGIATPELVISASRAGMLSFFGSAGLGPERIAEALDRIENGLAEGASWGANLIHSPNQPGLEMATADLFIRRGVRRVSASAFMGLTPAIVRYAASGLSVDPGSGATVRHHHLFAKISRPEVARNFLLPAPAEMLDSLVAQGLLSSSQAALARYVPVAEDITAEADSGGHTDNRPLTVLLPTILRLRDEICARYGYKVRVGAAGGLGTPSAVAAAFAAGAAYVMTGSINQSSIEAGTSPEVKRMLAEASMADVAMAPAADMFELGVKVQVLKRGSLFSSRAHLLYDTYLKYRGLDELPEGLRRQLEKDIFREPLEDAWRRTRDYWLARDPSEVEQAEADAKHRMALCFRAYLGLASRWARSGESGRRLDYQIWCGPAMGAFNAWAKGSFLEHPENRTVTQIGLNVMEGAAVVTRAQQLRTYAVDLPAASFDYRPRPLA